MKVPVKEGQSGFIYGVLRTEGKEFTLKPIKHSVEKDKDGDPVIISVKQQFSHVWMEEVNKKPEESEDLDPEELNPADMKVKDLNFALKEAGVDIPDGAKKADLVKLLEDYLSSQ